MNAVAPIRNTASGNCHITCPACGRELPAAPTREWAARQLLEHEKTCGVIAQQGVMHRILGIAS